MFHSDHGLISIHFHFVFVILALFHIDSAKMFYEQTHVPAVCVLGEGCVCLSQNETANWKILKQCAHVHVPIGGVLRSEN